MTSPLTSPRRIKNCEETCMAKPEWTRPLPGSLAAPLGQTFALECEASGSPAPAGRWLKRGRDVAIGTRISSASRDGTLRLTILSLTKQDEGDYSCEATNSSGSVTTRTHLRIGTPPKITKLPSELQMPENSDVTVKVLCAGDQPVDVTLAKDGCEVQESARCKFTAFVGYVLVFVRNASPADSGTYKIALKNKSGETSGEFRLSVTGLPGAPRGPLAVGDVSRTSCQLAWRPPSATGGLPITHYLLKRNDTTGSSWVTVSPSVRDTKISVANLTEGHQFHFRVQACNGNGAGPPLSTLNAVRMKAPFEVPSAPPQPRVLGVGADYVKLSWAEPGDNGGARIQGYLVEKCESASTTWQRVNSTPCASLELTCANLIEGRNYVFRVAAKNEAGFSRPSAHSEAALIIDPSATTRPEVQKALSDVSCIQGRRAEFACCISGTPAPTISWYRGAREINSGRRYHIRSEGTEHSLTVLEVSTEDADEYVCRAVNIAGVKSTRAELFIKSPIKFNLPPKLQSKVSFDKSETIVVKVPFSGSPLPRVTWALDGTTIRADKHFDIDNRERHTMLTIRDAGKCDSGVYTIAAENDFSKDSVDVNIEVRDRPDPPSCPAVDSVAQDSLMLSWKCPLWDGGSYITSYTVEKRQFPLLVWSRVGLTRFTTLAVGDLVPGWQYEFRIFAENVYGRSDPSDVTNIISTKSSVRKEFFRKKSADTDSGDIWRGLGKGGGSLEETVTTPSPCDGLNPADYGYLDIENNNTSIDVSNGLKEDVAVIGSGSDQAKDEVETKAPLIVDHPKSRTVNCGESVSLSCRITGAKKFKVVWYHNNLEVKDSQRFNYTKDGEIHELYISKTLEEDAGSYACRAFNDIGETSSACSIFVLKSGEIPVTPQYTVYPTSATVSASEPAVFIAENKRPPLELQWLKDGQPIDETSPRYLLRMEGPSKYRFEITSCGPEDAGHYQARAVGRKGDSLAVFSINIAG